MLRIYSGASSPASRPKRAPQVRKSRSLIYEQGVATYMAPGGIGSSPRDISNRGALQAFCHRTDSADLLWYVDESSPDNTLHLALGQPHIRALLKRKRAFNAGTCRGSGTATTRPLNAAQRQAGLSEADPNQRAIRTLIQVRARAANPPA